MQAQWRQDKGASCIASHTHIEKWTLHADTLSTRSITQSPAHTHTHIQFRTNKQMQLNNTKQLDINWITSFSINRKILCSDIDDLVFLPLTVRPLLLSVQLYFCWCKSSRWCSCCFDAHFPMNVHSPIGQTGYWSIVVRRQCECVCVERAHFHIQKPIDVCGNERKYKKKTWEKQSKTNYQLPIENRNYIARDKFI